MILLDAAGRPAGLFCLGAWGCEHCRSQFLQRVVHFVEVRPLRPHKTTVATGDSNVDNSAAVIIFCRSPCGLARNSIKLVELQPIRKQIVNGLCTDTCPYDVA